MITRFEIRPTDGTSVYAVWHDVLLIRWHGGGGPRIQTGWFVCKDRPRCVAMHTEDTIVKIGA